MGSLDKKRCAHVANVVGAAITQQKSGVRSHARYVIGHVVGPPCGPSLWALLVGLPRARGVSSTAGSTRSIDSALGVHRSSTFDRSHNAQ
jgi:hypothetical protein